LIAGGCANLKDKIQLENQNQPLILRIYLRDKDAALQKNGIKLPTDWRSTAHLLNLSSLLDLLKRSDPKDHPHRCADIRELINHILSELNNMQKIDRVEIKSYDPN